MSDTPVIPLVRLGSSPLEVSRIGYGGWRITGVADPELITPEKEAIGERAVLTAFESGINLFDLADIYCQGRCEELFGKVLRQVSGMRDSVVIVTKCGIRLANDPAPRAPYRYDFSADYIVKCCEGSLKRMGIEVVDLFMLHRPDYLGDPEEVAAAFTRLEESGKVRFFGLSNFSPSQVSLLRKRCPQPLVAHQVEVSLMHLDPFHDGTLDQCLADGMTPLAWSPLGGGRLVDPNPIELNRSDHAHRIHVREVMDQVAREVSGTRTTVALAWLLKHPARIVPLVGSIRPERIREAVSSVQTELTREQWYQLLEVSHGKRLP